MADKVQKIREEVVRLHNLLPVMDGDNISVNYADRICTALKMYIDSLKEEPVSDDLEKAAINAADEDMQGRQIMEASNDERQRYSRIFRRGFKAGDNWQKERVLKAMDLGEPPFLISVEQAYYNVKKLLED